MTATSNSSKSAKEMFHSAGIDHALQANDYRERILKDGATPENFKQHRWYPNYKFHSDESVRNLHKYHAIKIKEDESEDFAGGTDGDKEEMIKAIYAKGLVVTHPDRDGHVQVRHKNGGGSKSYGSLKDAYKETFKTIKENVENPDFDIDMEDLVYDKLSDRSQYIGADLLTERNTGNNND